MLSICLEWLIKLNPISVDLFINNDPHASRLVHVQTFKETIFRQCHSPDPSSTSSALLHAVCAAASRYVEPPVKRTTSSDSYQPANSEQVSKNSSISSGASFFRIPEGFGSFHATRARKLISTALAEHQESLLLEQEGGCIQTTPGRPMSPFTNRLATACSETDKELRKRRIRNIRDDKLFHTMVVPLLILTTYYYHEGKGTEVWADIGALSRALMSLG